MAVRKAEKKEEIKTEECKTCKCCNSKWLTVGWVLLLLGGLAHMMPTQMAPILNWSLWGITVQTVVGVLSVVFALYYLLEDYI
jgi:hypothetical protein